MANENLISCSKCKGRVPLNDLRADRGGKSWICLSCYSIQHPNLRTPTMNFNSQKQNSQQTMQKPVVEKTQLIEKPKPSVMSQILKKYNYQCNGCKYKFSRNQEYNGLCPFCGKENTLENLNMDLEI